MLESAPSIETLSLTYGSRPSWYKANASPQLSLSRFTQLRKVQLPESLFVGAVAAEQPVNTTPPEVLPVSVRTLVITHPIEHEHRSHPAYRPSTRVLSWMDGLHKTGFLDLELVDIVCSNGFGDVDVDLRR
jgi:hypothetical protein